MDIIGIIFYAVLYGIIYDSLKLAISLYTKKGKPVKKDNANPLSFLSSFLGGNDNKDDEGEKKKKRKKKRKRKEDIIEEDMTIPNLTEKVEKSSDSNDFFKDVRKSTQESNKDTPDAGFNGLLSKMLSGDTDTEGGNRGINNIIKMGAKLLQNGKIQEIMGELSKSSKGKEGNDNPLTNILKTIGDTKRIEKIMEKPAPESDQDDDIKNIIESLD